MTRSKLQYWATGKRNFGHWLTEKHWSSDSHSVHCCMNMKPASVKNCRTLWIFGSKTRRIIDQSKQQIGIKWWKFQLVPLSRRLHTWRELVMRFWMAKLSASWKPNRQFSSETEPGSHNQNARLFQFCFAFVFQWLENGSLIEPANPLIWPFFSPLGVFNRV